MKDNCLRRILSAAVFIVAGLGAAMIARDRNFTIPRQYYDEILELSLDDNVASPEIPRKQIPVITEYQKDATLRLKKQGVKVETMREGQVIVATLPAMDMFASNDSVLSVGTDVRLRPFIPLLTHPDMYKVLIAVHSDNTGSEEYVNDLTSARANAIYQWLGERNIDVSAVIPYGIGCDDPVGANNSRQNRAANRRVEIYLIPGPVMIGLAKSGKLSRVNR